MKKLLTLLFVAIICSYGGSQNTGGYKQFHKEKDLIVHHNEKFSSGNKELSLSSIRKGRLGDSNVSSKQVVEEIERQSNIELAFKLSTPRRLKANAVYKTYQQYYKGVEVEGGALVIEEVNGFVWDSSIN